MGGRVAPHKKYANWRAWRASSDRELACGKKSRALHVVRAWRFWREELGAPVFWAAPMVRQTDLAMRLQLRAHGADLCSTVMVDADVYVAGGKGVRRGYFSTCAEDRPLVAQIGATNVEDFVRCARLLQDGSDDEQDDNDLDDNSAVYVGKDGCKLDTPKHTSRIDCIELNLGCPQRRAEKQCFGAYLMDRPGLVMQMVSTAVQTLDVPVFCKIRLLPDLDDTIAFCRGLENAGCSVLTVHGRMRDVTRHDGVAPCDWGAIAAVKRALSIPVVANGGVDSMASLSACRRSTRADAIMVATALLSDPSLFSLAPTAPTRVATPSAQLGFCAEYLFLALRYGGGTPDTLRAHILETVLVPLLCPPSAKMLLVFLEGVLTAEDACERLCEIALVLAELAPRGQWEQREQQQQTEGQRRPPTPQTSHTRVWGARPNSLRRRARKRLAVLRCEQRRCMGLTPPTSTTKDTQLTDELAQVLWKWKVKKRRKNQRDQCRETAEGARATQQPQKLEMQQVLFVSTIQSMYLRGRQLAHTTDASLPLSKPPCAPSPPMAPTAVVGSTVMRPLLLPLIFCLFAFICWTQFGSMFFRFQLITQRPFAQAKTSFN